MRSAAAPEYEPYLLEFRRRIQGSLRYPLAARRRGLSGVAEIEVLVAPSGRVERVDLVRSSSHALLDEAALTAVREAAPPPLPPGLPSRSLRVRLPVVFELH